MKTIYKYQLKITGEQIIEMPSCAEILTVQIQNGNPCIWALVNPEHPKQYYMFRIFGTGHPIENDFSGKYIGTYQMENGRLVFHLFQV